MLDWLDFKINNINLGNLKIIDPSCGDGAFLAVIAKRIIKWGQQNQLTSKTISQILATNVYGIEIDPVVYQKCFERLEKVRLKNQLPPVE